MAEGVETEGQAGFLREQGCDKLQGYGVCRPLPTERGLGLARRARGRRRALSRAAAG